MSLSATVQHLLNKDQDAKAVAADRDAVVRSWQRDIEVVFQDFRDALKSFTDNGTARITEQEITVGEETFGDYQTKRLAISIVNRKLLLSPIARLTVGGTGRIDLYREDQPAEDRRIFLVRGTIEAGHHPETWLIEDRRERTNSFADGIANFQSIIRGRRKYTYLRSDSIQDAIDYLLNMA